MVPPRMDRPSEELTLILDTAAAFKTVGTREIKKVPALRGKTLVNFFESRPGDNFAIQVHFIIHADQSSRGAPVGGATPAASNTRRL